MAPSREAAQCQHRKTSTRHQRPLAALSRDTTGGGTARLARRPKQRGENSAQALECPCRQERGLWRAAAPASHSQRFSPCLAFHNRAQASPVTGDGEIPTGSRDAENTNQLSGALISAPSVRGGSSSPGISTLAVEGLWK